MKIMLSCTLQPNFYPIRSLLSCYLTLTCHTATTTVAAERLRNISVNKSPKDTKVDPKLNSFYSQTNGTGRVSVDNTTGKKPKLTSMYTKDSHLD